MIKVLSVTIRNFISSNNKNPSRTTEFDELNKYLEDGWSVIGYETVNSPNSSYFSMVYTITK